MDKSFLVLFFKKELLSSNHLSLERWLIIRRIEFHHPQVRIPRDLPVYIRVRSLLRHGRRAGGAHPGLLGVRGADAGEDHKAFGAAQDDEEAAGIRVTTAQDGAAAAGVEG
jgi:hypothetical protein